MRRSYSYLLLGAIVASLLGGTFTRGDLAQSPIDPKDDLDLRRRIAALEDRLAQVEKELEAVKASRLQVVPAPQVPPAIPWLPTPQRAIPAPPPDLPPDAREHRYNGLRYYVTPLHRPAQ